LYFKEYIENNRTSKNIDPVVCNFLFSAERWAKYILTTFSCQGHRKKEPAWVRFEIRSQQWWENFKNELERRFSFCEIKDDYLYVYHRNKHELFGKFGLIVQIGDRLCQSKKRKKETQEMSSK
jgi:hypothetical protein